MELEYLHVDMFYGIWIHLSISEKYALFTMNRNLKLLCTECFSLDHHLNLMYGSPYPGNYLTNRVNLDRMSLLRLRNLLDLMPNIMEVKFHLLSTDNLILQNYFSQVLILILNYYPSLTKLYCDDIVLSRHHLTYFVPLADSIKFLGFNIISYLFKDDIRTFLTQFTNLQSLRCNRLRIQQRTLQRELYPISLPLFPESLSKFTFYGLIRNSISDFIQYPSSILDFSIFPTTFLPLPYSPDSFSCLLSMTNLIILSIPHTNITDDQLLLIRQNLPNITSLNVGACFNLTEYGFCQFPLFTNLQKLSVSYLSVPYDILLDLTVQTLDVSHSHYDIVKPFHLILGIPTLKSIMYDNTGCVCPECCFLQHVLLDHDVATFRNNWPALNRSILIFVQQDDYHLYHFDHALGSMPRVTICDYTHPLAPKFFVDMYTYYRNLYFSTPYNSHSDSSDEN